MLTCRTELVMATREIGPLLQKMREVLLGRLPLRVLAGSAEVVTVLSVLARHSRSPHHLNSDKHFNQTNLTFILVGQVETLHREVESVLHRHLHSRSSHHLNSDKYFNQTVVLPPSAITTTRSFWAGVFTYQLRVLRPPLHRCFRLR